MCERDPAGKESRKRDRVADMMDIYWEEGEVEKKGGTWGVMLCLSTRGKVVRIKVWGTGMLVWVIVEAVAPDLLVLVGMKSGEKMGRVDFASPSGCCQVYK